MAENDLILSAQRVHESIPVRLARRIHDMSNLPYGVMSHPGMQQVYDNYVELFQRFIEFPQINTLHDEDKFTAFLPAALDGSKGVLSILARACRDIKNDMDYAQLHSFIDVMLKARISRRLLAEQHLAVHRQFYADSDYTNVIGIVSVASDPVQVITQTFQQAQKIARTYYGCAPKLEWQNPKPPTSFPYIPVCPHVYYCHQLMVVEPS